MLFQVNSLSIDRPFMRFDFNNNYVERAILEGSIRDFSQNDFEIIKEHMEMIVTNVGNSFGANCSIEW